MVGINVAYKITPKMGESLNFKEVIEHVNLQRLAISPFCKEEMKD